MHKDNNISEDVKTPSSGLTNLQIKDIQIKAEEWKNAKDGQTRRTLTAKFKQLYKGNEEAYEAFEKYKRGNKMFSKKRGPYTAHSDEAIARQFFADKLKECIKENFYMNSNIDVNDGIFLLDENCNLPYYFWTRMNTNVLPKMKKEGCNELRAWKLGAGIIDRHRDELNSILRNTTYSDLLHVSNSVIQFLNKYMLVTYKELVEKNRKMNIEKRKAQQAQAEIEQRKLWEQSINNINKEEEEQIVPEIGFDTTGLL